MSIPENNGFAVETGELTETQEEPKRARSHRKIMIYATAALAVGAGLWLGGLPKLVKHVVHSLTYGCLDSVDDSFSGGGGSGRSAGMYGGRSGCGEEIYLNLGWPWVLTASERYAKRQQAAIDELTAIVAPVALGSSTCQIVELPGSLERIDWVVDRTGENVTVSDSQLAKDPGAQRCAQSADNAGPYLTWLYYKAGSEVQAGDRISATASFQGSEGYPTRTAKVLVVHITN